MKFYTSNYFNSLEENSPLKKEWEQFLFSEPKKVDCQGIGGNVKNALHFLRETEDFTNCGEFTVCFMATPGILGLYTFDSQEKMFIFLGQILSIFYTERIAVEVPSNEISHFLQGKSFESPFPENLKENDFPTVIMFGDNPSLEDRTSPLAIFNAKQFEYRVTPENFNTFPLVAFGTEKQIDNFMDSVESQIKHWEEMSNKNELAFYTYWTKLENGWY